MSILFKSLKPSFGCYLGSSLEEEFKRNKFKPTLIIIKDDIIHKNKAQQISQTNEHGLILSNIELTIYHYQEVKKKYV